MSSSFSKKSVNGKKTMFSLQASESPMLLISSPSLVCLSHIVIPLWIYVVTNDRCENIYETSYSNIPTSLSILPFNLLSLLPMYCLTLTHCSPTFPQNLTLLMRSCRLSAMMPFFTLRSKMVTRKGLAGAVLAVRSCWVMEALAETPSVTRLPYRHKHTSNQTLLIVWTVKYTHSL